MNDLALFEGTTAVAMPEYFSDIFGDSTNIQPKQTTPQLSIKGGKFRVILDGEETVMTKPDADTGEPMPLTSVRLVVLNQNSGKSRAYYAEKYNSDNPAPPACFSLDGVKPDTSVAEPQAKTCASCPQAQKGSKISEASGKAITACTMQSRLVVIPASKLGFEPLLLRLAPTSAWDKNNEANEKSNWYAWRQYQDFLSARGIDHTAKVVTMVKFDTSVEYPKLLFKPERLLSREEALQLKDVWNSDKVKALLEAKEQDALGSHAPLEDDVPFETKAEAPAEEKKAKPEPKAKPEQKAKPEPKAEAAPKPEPKAEPEKANAGQAKLTSVLDEWD